MPTRGSVCAAVGALLAAFLIAAPAPAHAAKTTRQIGAHAMILPGMPAPVIDRLFASAAGAHIGIVRADVWPAAIFANSEQQPNWDSLDVVRDSARRHRIDVLGLLEGMPRWLGVCPQPSMDPLHCAPSDLAAWERMVEQIVARAPEIRYWEVLNEADHPLRFSGDPATYATLLRGTSQAVRCANPRAKVVFTGGCCRPAWIEQVLAYDMTGSFDIANAHLRGGVDKLDDMTRSVAATFRRYGFHGPLWITETGYPSDPAYQQLEGFRGGPRSQAAYMSNAVRTMLGSGAASVFIALRDGGHPWGPFASEGIVSFPGLVPKESYRAISDVAADIIRRPALERARRARTRTSRLCPGTCAPPSRASTTTR
jgi:hypothetical protein